MSADRRPIWPTLHMKFERWLALVSRWHQHGGKPWARRRDFDVESASCATTAITPSVARATKASVLDAEQVVVWWPVAIAIASDQKLTRRREH
jgi:hypothetical protein